MTPAISTSFDWSHEEFMAFAPGAVYRVSGALEPLLRESLGSGTWHPNGFQVFRLLDIEDVGLLRLHVWPNGLRRVRRQQPVVHSHIFHLYSLVLVGEYREKFFRVRETGASGAPGWSGWEVLPPRGDNVDRLAPESAVYSVESMGRVARCQAGTAHDMPAGVYHATLIPRGKCCVTLALLSRPVLGQRDHMVGRSGMTGASFPREAITKQDRAWAVGNGYEQVAHALSTHPLLVHSDVSSGTTRSGSRTFG